MGDDVARMFVRLLLCVAAITAATVASAAVGGCHSDHKELLIDGHVRSPLAPPR
jgi:hypothetical protein